MQLGSYPQRAQQFQPQPFGLVEGVENVALKRLKAAFGPKLQRRRLAGRSDALLVGLFGFPRQAGRDHENLRLHSQQLERVFGHESAYPGYVGLVEDIDLVDDDHDLLAPGADALHEQALALRERTVGAGDEKDQVGARHEVLGDLLVTLDHRVGAGCIHDIDLPQPFDGCGDHLHVGLDQRTADLIAMAQEVNANGRRRGAFLKQLLPEQRVDERRLAGVELAHDHQQKELVELPARLIQPRRVLPAGLEACQVVTKLL